VAFPFTVTIKGEAKNAEGDEQFFVNLGSNSSNAVVTTNQLTIKVHQP
jgi:hypothetical protein